MKEVERENRILEQILILLIIVNLITFGVNVFWMGLLVYLTS